MTERATLRTLLEPESIAVVGASDDLTKPGGLLVRNILLRGYEGEFMLVNPKRDIVQGVRAYPSVAELPSAPDLAFIAIPAPLVRQALQAMAERGARAVVVLSNGFGEVSEEGKEEEQRLVAIADEYGILLIGPNCSGIVSHAHAGKFSGLPPESHKGGVDFLSGSGATVDFLYENATTQGLRFNSLVNVGNSAQTGVTDLLRLYDEAQDEDSSRIKLIYVEVLNRPREFLKHARSLSEKGCLLAGIKSGSTEAGSRAAASHTGAMATNDTAVQALFDKAGIIRVRSRPELIDTAMALASVGDRLDGTRVAVISDAGGPGVMLADELNRRGFFVVPFGERTRQRLSDALPQGAGVGNPVDCLPTRNAETVTAVLDIISEEEKENVDYILLIDGESGLSDTWALFEAIMRFRERSTVPVLQCFLSPTSAAGPLKKLKEAGQCYFSDEVAMARALGHVVHRPRPTTPVLEIQGYDRAGIGQVLSGSGALPPDVARAVLDSAGIRLSAQREVAHAEDLQDVDIPFPWAMKSVGLLHKSDAGGVHLHIQSLKQAGEAWETLMRIGGTTAVLVQPMVSGTEVILGATREEGYGHLVAFGLGGIYTEVLKDVQFCLAPLSREEAHKMVRSIRAFPIVNGVRGQPALDANTLVDQLLRVGLLVHDFPQIREIDLNPVKGQGSELYAVDARIIVD